MMVIPHFIDGGRRLKVGERIPGDPHTAQGGTGIGI